MGGGGDLRTVHPAMAGRLGGMSVKSRTMGGGNKQKSSRVHTIKERPE